LAELVKNLAVRVVDATKDDLEFIRRNRKIFGNPSEVNSELKTMVAKYRGQIVGFIQVIKFPKTSQATIVFVGTRDGYTGQRVARTLIGKANAFFIRKGLKLSTLKESKSAAPRLNQSLGFYALKTNYKPQGRNDSVHSWVPVRSARGKKNRK